MRRIPETFYAILKSLKKEKLKILKLIIKKRSAYLT